MPKLSIWLVRSALVHMGVGFLFGSLILHHKGIPIYSWTWLLLNPHVEVMIFGWVIQFVMGVAFWALPRFSGTQRYGRTILGWWSFALLNTGIVLIALNTWVNSPAVLIAGLAGKATAVGLFIVLIWSRIKPIANFTVISNSQNA